MADANVGLLGGGALFGVIGASYAIKGAREMDKGPEFTPNALNDLIKGDNLNPGPAMEHAASELRIGGRVLDAQHEFAVMTQNGQLENINMWTRDAAGAVHPTEFAHDLAKMSRGEGRNVPGRGQMYFGVALLGIAVAAIAAGVPLGSDRDH